MTTTNATMLLHILNSKWGAEANEILKHIGRKQVRAIAYSIFKKTELNPEQALELLQYLEVFGYGSISMVSAAQGKEIIFRIKNSSVCLMKKKLFSFTSYENAFLVGICSGIAELLFSCMMDGEEIACMGNGKDSCLIKTEKKPYQIQSAVLKQFTLSSFEGGKSRTLSKAQAEIIKKVSGHYMIDWKDGLFTLWGCALFMIPTVSFVFLVKAFEEKFGDGINPLLYHLARAQSRESVRFQLEKMGFSKDITLLKSILEHSDMTGFGMVSLTNADFEKKILSIQQFYNPYPHYLRQLFGNSKEGKDHYVSGLLAGAAEGFYGVEMENKESRCLAKGDDCCAHESVQKKGEGLYPLEDEYLGLIEEKIRLKNFIL